jgi:hypothetical protein
MRAVSRVIELRGHIIDSLTFPKVLDHGADYETEKISSVEGVSRGAAGVLPERRLFRSGAREDGVPAVTGGRCAACP